MYAKAIIVGRLGFEPELRTSSGGKPYTVVKLVSERLKNGEKKPVWHNIFFWGSAAESLCNYATKGTLMFLEAEITYAPFEKLPNEKVTQVVLTAQTFKVLGGWKPKEEQGLGREINASKKLDNEAIDFPF